MSKGLKARSQPVGAVAQRDELVRKRDAAYNVYARHTQERQRVEADVTRLARRVHEANGVDDDAADVEQALEGAQRELTIHLGKANAALDRTKGLEAEIDALYGREFAAFAEEASDVSKAAQVALADFLEAWRRAKSMWQAATEAWAPLCRSARIPGVPPFPVTEHQLSEVLNGEATAHPGGVEIFEDGDELD